MWKARTQGNGGVGTKEGTVRDKNAHTWCGGFRKEFQDAEEQKEVRPPLVTGGRFCRGR